MINIFELVEMSNIQKGYFLLDAKDVAFNSKIECETAKGGFSFQFVKQSKTNCGYVYYDLGQNTDLKCNNLSQLSYFIEKTKKFVLVGIEFDKDLTAYFHLKLK